jgi:hypothetical protein
MLVDVERDRPLLALELDRQDLRLWKWPSLRAAVARRWLDGERVLLLARDAAFRRDVLAVTPMWTVSNGSVSAPTIMSIDLLSPIRAAPAA